MKRTKNRFKFDKVAHWIKQIDRILDNDVRFVFDRRKSAKKALKGIKKTIEETNCVTDNQIQAIQNIKHGKNEF